MGIFKLLLKCFIDSNSFLWFTRFDCTDWSCMYRKLKGINQRDVMYYYEIKFQSYQKMKITK